MANRDENLKKINSELEMLSDEELEKIAGGGDPDPYNPGHFAPKGRTILKKESDVNIENPVDSNRKLLIF